MTISTITPLPAAPSRSDPPATFIPKADAFVAGMTTLGTELNTSIGEMNTDIAQVNADASNAASAATDAENSAAAAAAAANLLGNWSAQTGSQNKPASVVHNGSLWALLNNLADITASEPGVSADWHEIKVISATTETVTASGSVAIGDMVAINTDGTGSAVAQTDSAVSGNTISTFESGDMSTYPLERGCLIYVEDDSALVLVYNDPGVGLYLIAFTVNATTGALSAGTPVAVVGSECGGYSVAYGTVNDQIVTCYSYSNNLYARNFTLSGTTIAAVTTEVLLEADNADLMQLVHDADYTTNDRFWLFYRAQDHSNAGYYLDITNTSGTITDSSIGSFESGAVLDIDACYVGNSMAVVTFIDDADTDTPKAVFSGWTAATTLGVGTAFELTADSAGGTCVTYDSVGNLVTFFYYNETKTQHECVIFQPPGSYSTNVNNNYEAQAVTTSWSHQPTKFELVFNPVNGLYFYFFDDVTTAGDVCAFSRDGGLLVEESTAEFESGTGVTGLTAAVDPNNGFPVIAYVDGAATSAGRLRTINPPSTDMNMWGFRGIATTAAADAASFTLQLSGVNTDQSGLTAGQDYWVSNDGSLVTYPVGPYVGRARSATSIDLDAKNPAQQVLKKAISNATADAGTPMRLRNGRLEKIGTLGKIKASKLDVDAVAEDLGTLTANSEWYQQAAAGTHGGCDYDPNRKIMCTSYWHDSSDGAGTDSLYIAWYDMTNWREPVFMGKQSIQATTPYQMEILYVESLDRWMLTWTRSANKYPYYHQFSIDSGGYTSLSSPTNLPSAAVGGSQRNALKWDEDAQRWLYAYNVAGTYNVYIAEDNGGSTLTWNANTLESAGGTIGNSFYYGIDLEYDPVEQVWQALYSYTASYYLRQVAFTISGVSITKGTPAYAFATSTNLNYPFLKYAPSVGAVIAICFDTSNNIYSERHTATGTSISITNADTDTLQNCAGYSSYDFGCHYDSDKDEILIISFAGRYIDLRLDPATNLAKNPGAAIAIGGYVTGEGANYGQWYWDDETKVIHNFSGEVNTNPGGGDAVKHMTWVFDFPVTDSDEMVSIIGHDTKPGAETSLVVGGIVGGLSGLTPNSDYYVDNNGNAITKNVGGARIGKAISSTELVI